MRNEIPHLLRENLHLMQVFIASVKAPPGLQIGCGKRLPCIVFEYLHNHLNSKPYSDKLIGAMAS